MLASDDKEEKGVYVLRDHYKFTSGTQKIKRDKRYPRGAERANIREALQMCLPCFFSDLPLSEAGCWTVSLWSDLIQYFFSMLFDTGICFKMGKLIFFSLMFLQFY